MYNLLIYLFAFIFEFVLCFFASKTKNKVLLFFSFLLPVLFVGFRYNVGTDYKNYISTFNVTKKMNFHQLFGYDWEFGGLLILIIASLLNSERIMFIIIAILNIFPLFKINKIYDYKYLPLSILTYNCLYLAFCMNGMRQGIAMSFILYSTILLLNIKKTSSIICFIIAFLFHKSSILFLPYYLLLLFDKSEGKNRFMKQSMIITLGISLLILFLLKNILLNIGILKYSSYINKIDTSNISFGVIISSIPILMIIFLSTIQNKISNSFKPIVVSGLIFYIVGTSAQYLYRIGLYFTYFEIFLIPYLIENIKDKRLKFIIFFAYIVYLFIYFWRQFYVVGQHEIFPYQFQL